MNSSMVGTFLTKTKIEQILQGSGKLECEGNKLTNIRAEPATESAGYTSTIYRVLLQWNSSQPSLPQSVVIKVIGSPKIVELFASMPKEALERHLASVAQAHDTECSVYSFGGLSKEISIPKFFGALRSGEDEAGVLILEDLTTTGFVMSMTTLGAGLSNDLLEQILDVVTSAHAWSVNTREDWKQLVPSVTECQCILAIAAMPMNYYDKSANEFPEIFNGINKTKFERFVSREHFLEIFGCDPRAKYDLPLVLVHGDIHRMNMILEKDQKKERLLSLIDWQTAHQGCGIEDLSKIMWTCMSQEQRHERKEKMLQRYVELFNAKVKSPEQQVAYENAKRAFDDMYSFNAALGICCLSLQKPFLCNIAGTDEEKAAIRERVVSNITAMFDDVKDKIDIW